MRAFSAPQILAVVIMVTLTPLTLFGAAALYLWDRNERAAHIAALSAHSEALSQAVDREIRNYRETLETLANAPGLQKGRIDVFESYAQIVANIVGGHFALIDRDMQQLANTTSPIGAPLPPARETDLIKEVLATGKTKVSNFSARIVSGQTQLKILTPVKVGSEVYYVLGYAPAPASIQALVMETYRPHGWLAAVLDGGGTIIARSVGYDEFFGRPASANFLKRIASPTGSMRSTDLEGRHSMTSWHTTDHDWKVIVWAPIDILERQTKIALRILLGAALATLLISIVASWLVSRLIRDPAERLAVAAHKLGEGAPIEFEPTRMKEANAIAVSLAEAAELIQRREADLRASEAHTNLIMRELSHRSKNLLALVQAMARQSARVSTNFTDFAPRFIERLQSLAMSHDLLVKTEWTSVGIRDLIAEQIRAFVDNPRERLMLIGDDLLLKPEAAQNLGMAFHELGSNAVKHGSLSEAGGQVRIEWRVEGEGDASQLVLRWSEHGGPPAREPERRGFGTTILRKLIPASLHAQAEFAWGPDGFTWTLRAPMNMIVRSPYMWRRAQAPA